MDLISKYGNIYALVYVERRYYSSGKGCICRGLILAWCYWPCAWTVHLNK